MPKMPRGLHPCATPGCPELIPPATTRCPTCSQAKAKHYDSRRESQTVRGYSSTGHRRFRRRVLDSDPLCVICGDVATVADHWPIDRRELIDQGLDPNDPKRGRGLCASCHGRETAVHQPGGWNYR